jgi:hypothetical protein
MLLVLRLAPSLPVWRAVALAYLVCDVGHVWAVYAADRPAFWHLTAWTADECLNVGILAAGLLLRVAFLCGIGVRVKGPDHQRDARMAGKRE